MGEDCDQCGNYPGMCDECSENPEFDNHFIFMTPEMKENRMLEGIKHEVITLTPDEKFMKRYELARKFIRWEGGEERHIAEFHGVYCGPGYLLATNTHIMIKTPTDIPEPLKGKHIFKIDGDQVFLSQAAAAVFENGKMLEILNAVDGQTMTFKPAEIPIEPFTYEERFSGTKNTAIFAGKVAFNPEYLEAGLAGADPEEEITITYKGESDHVKITARDYEAVILPIRDVVPAWQKSKGDA